MSGAAHEGRVNPRGIPCLYAASNLETAVAEVRPWLGALVSVAQLSPVRLLRLVNCSDGHDSKLAYDGVAYKSKLGQGFNLALFDLASAEVHEVRLYPVVATTVQVGEVQHSYVVKRRKLGG